MFDCLPLSKYRSVRNGCPAGTWLPYWSFVGVSRCYSSPSIITNQNAFGELSSAATATTESMYKIFSTLFPWFSLWWDISQSLTAMILGLANATLACCWQEPYPSSHFSQAQWRVKLLWCWIRVYYPSLEFCRCGYCAKNDILRYTFFYK